MDFILSVLDQQLKVWHMSLIVLIMIIGFIYFNRQIDKIDTEIRKLNRKAFNI